MVFKWQKLELISKDLHKKGSKAFLDKESNYRSSINRAYYCAFNLVLSYAKVELSYVKSKKQGTHKSLINFLKRNRDHRIKKLGSLLDNIRKSRVNCDYRDDIIIADKKSTEVQSILSDIIKLLNSL